MNVPYLLVPARTNEYEFVCTYHEINESLAAMNRASLNLFEPIFN